MSARAAAWLAWSLAALCVAMFVALGALYVLLRSTHVPRLTLIDLLVGVPFLAFPIVGALIASRRPHNPIGWICLAVGFLFLLLGLTDLYSVYGAAQPGSVPFPVVIYALGQWLWVPAVGLVGTYLLMLFPDGSLPSRRWRPLGWISGVMIVVLSATILLAPRAFGGSRGRRTQPVWARRSFLGGGCILCCFLTAPPVHPRFGGEHGVAFPAFEG